MSDAQPGRESLLRRRVLGPLARVLQEGHSPEKIALSLALGVGLGLFPIFGTTTLLCVGVAVLLRLNHPVIQVANQLMYPIQLPLILVFVRLGEILLGATSPVAAPMVATELAAAARPAAFLERFGTAGLHGILGWIVVAPAVTGAAYVVALPLVRLLARRVAPPAPAA